MRELDLHGLTIDEAIRVFIERYNRHVQSNREPLRIIHGWGSSGEGGKIRRKIREFLAEATDKLDWKPGEDVEGNLGVTIVYPRKVLPARENQLTEAIASFCSTPRTESKIAGEFRTHNAREIKQAIRTLIRQGRLQEIVKGSHAVYLINRPGGS
jgi:Smr domain-containing protein